MLPEGTVVLTRPISDNLFSPRALFVTPNNDIYVTYDTFPMSVYKWKSVNWTDRGILISSFNMYWALFIRNVQGKVGLG
jgi:hypothetical protein